MSHPERGRRFPSNPGQLGQINLVNPTRPNHRVAGNRAPAYCEHVPPRRPRVVCLFPGQGSHTSDLRAQVARNAPQLLERCCEMIGEDPFPRVRESTRFAQPAIFCASVANWMRHEDSLHPLAFAGHSLGELSALVAAQALDPLLGLELAVARGELMARASEGDREDGMLALLGASLDTAGDLALARGVVVASDNADGQVVLAGSIERLRATMTEARARGLRAMMLDVTGAFHSPAMDAAVNPFRTTLDRVTFGIPTVPVISGATAAPFENVRAELALAIVQPVRWRETMIRLARLGPDAFVDVGPGTVLARLVTNNLPEALVLNPMTWSPEWVDYRGL